MDEYYSLIELASAGHEMPAGCDRWGVRTRQATTSFYTYPETGWAEAVGPILDHDEVGQHANGDGLSVAYTWAGLATIKRPAKDLMLVAFANEDCVSREDRNTARLRRLYVVADFDGVELVRERGFSADLESIHLGGCDLRGAELFGANLEDANLEGANLEGATLYGANLRNAWMKGARLTNCNLRHADLRFARLPNVRVDASTSVQGADMQNVHEPTGKIFGASFR